MPLRNSLSRALVLTADRLEDRIDSDCDPAIVIAVAKMRLDFVFGDIECRDVGQRPLQAVTDLDKHFAVLNEHKKNDAVASFLLANAPGLGDTLRVVCDIGVALHPREDGDHDLVRCFALKLRELFIKTERSFL